MSNYYAVLKSAHTTIQLPNIGVVNGLLTEDVDQFFVVGIVGTSISYYYLNEAIGGRGVNGQTQFYQILGCLNVSDSNVVLNPYLNDLNKHTATLFRYRYLQSGAFQLYTGDPSNPTFISGNTSTNLVEMNTSTVHSRLKLTTSYVQDTGKLGAGILYSFAEPDPQPWTLMTLGSGSVPSTPLLSCGICRDGVIWVVDNTHTVFKRSSLSGNWTPYPGVSLVTIACEIDSMASPSIKYMVAGIGTDGAVYKLNNSNNTWDNLGSTGIDVAVTSTQAVWAIGIDGLPHVLLGGVLAGYTPITTGYSLPGIPSGNKIVNIATSYLGGYDYSVYIVDTAGNYYKLSEAIWEQYGSGVIFRGYRWNLLCTDLPGPIASAYGVGGTVVGALNGKASILNPPTWKSIANSPTNITRVSTNNNIFVALNSDGIYYQNIVLPISGNASASEFGFKIFWDTTITYDDVLGRVGDTGIRMRSDSRGGNSFEMTTDNNCHLSDIKIALIPASYYRFKSSSTKPVLFDGLEGLKGWIINPSTITTGFNFNGSISGSLDSYPVYNSYLGNYCTSDKLTLSSWQIVSNPIINPGILVSVSIGIDGTIWAVNNQNRIYTKLSISSPWVMMPGSLKQVSCGNKVHVIGLGLNNQVYQYIPTINGWTLIPGLTNVISVSIGPDGSMLAIISNHNIYGWNNNIPGAWIMYSNNNSYIQIVSGSPTSPYALDSSGNLFKSPWSVVVTSSSGLSKIVSIATFNNKVLGCDTQGNVYILNSNSWSLFSSTPSLFSVAFNNDVIVGLDSSGNLYTTCTSDYIESLVPAQTALAQDSADLAAQEILLNTAISNLVSDQNILNTQLADVNNAQIILSIHNANLTLQAAIADRNNYASSYNPTNQNDVATYQAKIKAVADAQTALFNLQSTATAEQISLGLGNNVSQYQALVAANSSSLSQITADQAAVQAQQAIVTAKEEVVAVDLSTLDSQTIQLTQCGECLGSCGVEGQICRYNPDFGFASIIDNVGQNVDTGMGTYVGQWFEDGRIIYKGVGTGTGTGYPTLKQSSLPFICVSDTPTYPIPKVPTRSKTIYATKPKTKATTQTLFQSITSNYAYVIWIVYMCVLLVLIAFAFYFTSNQNARIDQIIHGIH